MLIATATSLNEAKILTAAGIDAVVAQGFEAGGHRGVFDPKAPDDRLGTLALTRVLVRNLTIPVIAAGGIMDGAGIAAALVLGARRPARNRLHRLPGVRGGRRLSSPRY